MRALARQVVVERISTVSGLVLGPDYRTEYQLTVAVVFGCGRAALIWISPDPTGRYLLFSDETNDGSYTGWLGHGELHLLPGKQPYFGSAW